MISRRYALGVALAFVCIGVLSVGAIDFDVFRNCKDCIKAGFGWCPNLRRCGGFANNRCRGDVTDTRRGAAEEKEFQAARERGGPPPPPPRQQPPPQQQQQQQRGGGGGGGDAGGNPLKAGSVIEFSMNIEKHLTAHSIKTQLIVFTNSVNSDETKPLKKAAKKLRSRALVVRIVAKDFKMVFERFGFKLGKTRLPQVAIADFSRDAGLEVYRRTDPSVMKRGFDLSSSTREGTRQLISFIESFDKGELPVYCRSHALPAYGFNFPAYPNGEVLPIVGDNFNAAVLNSKRSALVFAFMPGCAHCKAFNETFYLLAPQFAMRTQFMIMDGTQNDIDHPVATFKLGYPSIWFFGKTGKDKPVQHNERDRGKKSFAAWLNRLLAADDAARRSNAKASKKAGSDDDDMVFADDDDEADDDNEEYVRPVKPAEAAKPPPPPPPPPPPAPEKKKKKKKEPKPAAAAAAAGGAIPPDDVLWTDSDRFQV